MVFRDNAIKEINDRIIKIIKVIIKEKIKIKKKSYLKDGLSYLKDGLS